MCAVGKLFKQSNNTSQEKTGGSWRGTNKGWRAAQRPQRRTTDLLGTRILSPRSPAWLSQELLLPSKSFDLRGQARPASLVGAGLWEEEANIRDASAWIQLLKKNSMDPCAFVGISCWPRVQDKSVVAQRSNLLNFACFSQSLGVVLRGAVEFVPTSRECCVALRSVASRCRLPRCELRSGPCPRHLNGLRRTSCRVKKPISVN